MKETIINTDHTRATFYGTFHTIGYKETYKGKPIFSIFLKNIKDESGNIIIEEKSFTLSKRFNDCRPFNEGSVIQFSAIVKSDNFEIKIQNPSKIKRI